MKWASWRSWLLGVVVSVVVGRSNTGGGGGASRLAKYGFACGC